MRAHFCIMSSGMLLPVQVCIENQSQRLQSEIFCVHEPFATPNPSRARTGKVSQSELSL